MLQERATERSCDADRCEERSGGECATFTIENEAGANEEVSLCVIEGDFLSTLAGGRRGKGGKGRKGGKGGRIGRRGKARKGGKGGKGRNTELPVEKEEFVKADGRSGKNRKLLRPKAVRAKEPWSNDRD